MNIYREITPLNDQDVFVLLDSHSNGIFIKPSLMIHKSMNLI